MEDRSKRFMGSLLWGRAARVNLEEDQNVHNNRLRTGVCGCSSSMRALEWALSVCARNRILETVRGTLAPLVTSQSSNPHLTRKE